MLFQIRSGLDELSLNKMLLYVFITPDDIANNTKETKHVVYLANDLIILDTLKFSLKPNSIVLLKNDFNKTFFWNSHGALPFKLHQLQHIAQSPLQSSCLSFITFFSFSTSTLHSDSHWSRLAATPDRILQTFTALVTTHLIITKDASAEFLLLWSFSVLCERQIALHPY